MRSDRVMDHAPGSAAAFSYAHTNTNIGCQQSGSGQHAVDSSEFQAAALNDGIADYYATLAFNITTQSSCERAVAYTVDWDDDGPVGDSQWYSCNGALPGSTKTKDYWWWANDGTGSNSCRLGLPSNYNYGVQSDWDRFFFDLVYSQGLASDDIWAIYSSPTTAPSSWNTTGNGWSSGYPSWELWNSAVNAGFQSEWEAEWDNGPIR